MPYTTLDFVVADGIATLTLNRPQARNALDMTMRTEMADVVRELAASAQIRALILTGAGEHFCAGGDLRSMSEQRRPPHASRGRVKAVHRWLRDLVDLEMPVIAAVDGAAYGAGFSFALAADFILATPRAKELIYSARVLPAQEAQALGIVYALHPPEQLLPAAQALARRFSHASREALGLSKNILNQALHLDAHALEDLESHAQAVCMSTDYYQDAVQRTLDRQPLAFDWERLTREGE